LDDVVAKVPLHLPAVVPPPHSALQVATTLFSIPAVHALYFGPDFITVTRARTPASAALAWEDGLKDEIAGHLEKFCHEQEEQQQCKEAQRLDSSAHFDDPTEALIVDIIETQVSIQTPVINFWPFLSAPLPLCLTPGRCGRWFKRTAGTSYSNVGTS
jgi:hypothetical protein